MKRLKNAPRCSGCRATRARMCRLRGGGGRLHMHRAAGGRTRLSRSLARSPAPPVRVCAYEKAPLSVAPLFSCARSIFFAREYSAAHKYVSMRRRGAGERIRSQNFRQVRVASAAGRTATMLPKKCSLVTAAAWVAFCAAVGLSLSLEHCIVNFLWARVAFLVAYVWRSILLARMGIT